MKVIKENGITRYIADENDEVIQISEEQYVELYKQQIEQKATNLVKTTLQELDYDNEGEVALYANNPKSIWYEEAKTLQTWIEDVYKKMYELQDNVTIDNYKDIDLDKIEAEYPVFKFNE